MLFLGAISSAAILAFAPTALAADAAKCGAHGWSLTVNKGQSPCEIASLMVGKGSMPEDSPYSPLSDLGQDRYTIPLPAEADDLRCNPVFYNLVAGCSACQTSSSTTWTDWETWTAHCKNVSGVGYIASVMPYDTPLPNWAFVDPLATNGTFNATVARAIADTDIPETIFNVKSATTTDSDSTTVAASSCSSKAGPIAGAAVGGAAGGALLGALVMLLLRKKNGRKDKDGNASVHSRESEDTIMREKAQNRA